MSNISTYFKNTNVFIEGNPCLRKLQREAHFTLKEEFSSDPESHKIIVLPTGTGKTGVIALAPYNISNGRVLVITPSLVIREGISDEFDTRAMFNFWTKSNTIANEDNLPVVYRYAGFSSASDSKRVKKLLEKSNIVISNIHKVYNGGSKKELAGLLDPNFFDMIIIDEAHHSAADSWIGALNYFNAKKIVKLTATPYRTDAKEIGGKIIYSYPLADAIKDGYIKNIISEDYTNEQLTFEIKGRSVSKEEALQEMDKQWITRSVAYSEQCSRTIVEMSIKRLNEKRELGSPLHQIIAVACSIDHAEQIKDLYNEYGLSAEYVSSNRQDASEKAIKAFKKGQIDVIVNVDMLGEGFDHPPISIAAIFRPFRSLSPYAQFIGRALRVISGDQIVNEIDNIAHVVYHKELGLDELWEYYSKQKIKASNRKIIELEVAREYFQNRDFGNVLASGNIVHNAQSFLNDGICGKNRMAIKNAIDEINNEIKLEMDKMRAAGVSEEYVLELEKIRQKKLDEKIDKKRTEAREELIREELQERHLSDIIDQVDNLFEKVKLDPQGTELPSSTSSTFLKGTSSNIGYVRKYVNSNLKKRLGRGIDEWETYDFNIAKDTLPTIINQLASNIEKKRNEKGW